MKRPPQSPPSPVARAQGDGPLRPLVLTVGIFYLAMALSEILLGSEGLIFRDRQVLLFANAQNLIHWGLGAILVLGFLLGRFPARVAALVVGAALLALAAAGALARHRVGVLLGFGSVPLPFAYVALHGLSGLLLVLVAFANRRPKAPVTPER